VLRRWIHVIVCVLAALPLMLSSASAAYSDRYAINPNAAAWYVFGNDCTS
jgi:hypothetical protein